MVRVRLIKDEGEENFLADEPMLENLFERIYLLYFFGPSYIAVQD